MLVAFFVSNNIVVHVNKTLYATRRYGLNLMCISPLLVVDLLMKENGL